MAGKDIDYSERFDPKIAEAMIEASKKIGGLPAYLGMELEEFSSKRNHFWNNSQSTYPAVLK